MAQECLTGFLSLCTHSASWSTVCRLRSDKGDALLQRAGVQDAGNGDNQGQQRLDQQCYY